MSIIRNYWGPAYAGVGGLARKMYELAVMPANWPFTVGSVTAFLVMSAVPISDQDRKESKYANRHAIMEEKFKKTGSYH